MSRAFRIQEVSDVLQQELSTLAQRIRDNHVQAGQVASGRTLASIQQGVQTDAEGVSGWIEGRSPFGTLETGRKPGKTPAGFVNIIRQWMSDKGIKAMPIPYVRRPSERWQPKYTPQERGELSMAGSIAYTIRTKGTKQYREGARSDIYSQPIEDTMNSLSKRITALFDKEIQHINLNT